MTDKPLTYVVRWGKTGTPHYVDADHLEETVQELLEAGARKDEIIIDVDEL